MGNIRSKVRNILLILIILFVIINYVRIFMFIPIWLSPQNTSYSYLIVGKDVRVLAYNFMPNSKLLSTYLDDNGLGHQLGIIKGSYGRRILWKIWNVGLPHRPINLIYCEDDFEPVSFEYTALVNEGSSCKAFPKVKETVYFVAQFNNEFMKVDGMKLEKVIGSDFNRLKEIQQMLEQKITK